MLRFLQTIALGALVLSLSACEPAASVGTACTRSSECSAPLECRLGRCRSECAASRDCAVGTRCLLDPAGLGACSIASDDACETGGGTACPTGLTCLAGRCVNTCEDAAECPSDGECREAAGAGVSFCFAPAREDGGAPIDAAADDAGTGQDAGADAGTGATCTTSACAIDLCLGESFACAVRGDHHVVCWGSNQLGQLGDGLTVDTPSTHGVAGSFDGGVLDAGDGGDAGVGRVDDASPVPVEVQRDDHSVLLASTVACAASTACARDDATGRIVCWGDGGNGELLDPGGGSAALAIELPELPLGIETLHGGRAFFCATFAAPTPPMCWGDDARGAFGVPMARMMDNPAEVDAWEGQLLATGATATCGLDRATSTVRCAGWNLYGEIGPSATLGATVWEPVALPPFSGTVTSIAVGDSFACALVDGVASCWGVGVTNSLGRMATQTCEGTPEACDPTPMPVSGSARFDALWAEGFTGRVCARSGGETWCWGNLSDIGCEEPSGACARPHVVRALAGATRVAASTRAVCAILSDGAVTCAGSNYFGQLGRGTFGAWGAATDTYATVDLAP